jgi:hypothetical protein
MKNGYRSHPSMLFRVTDHFKDKGAEVEFVSKDGIPVQDEHGAFTLVAKNESAESLTSAILSHYGLTAIPF